MRNGGAPRLKVVVVGAGAIGLSAAVELLGLGAEVTVLERGHVGQGSSGLSVGIVETQYLRPLDIELRVWSMGAFEALRRDHGLPIVRNGYLRLAHTTEAAAAFEESVATQRELGVKRALVLDREGVTRAVPDLRVDDVVAGLYGPDDGYLDGHLYCSLLAELVRDGGGNVLERCGLLGAGRRAAGRHRLSTEAGTIDCDAVVNAAGAWAAEVGRLIDAPAPVFPQRHQAASAHLGRELPYIVPSVMDYTPASGEYGVYFRHEGPGRLVAGLHSEEAIHELADPNAYHRSADFSFLELLAEKLADRLPDLADDMRLGSGWAGLYPVSPDGLPQVGPHPHAPTLVSACGAGGSGIQTSPILGRLAAEWVVYGEARALAHADALLPSRASLASRVQA
jgi:sarcosine oxidase subunit beta